MPDAQEPTERDGAASNPQAAAGPGQVDPGSVSDEDTSVELRYQTTLKAIGEFEEALSSLDISATSRSDRMREVMCDAINSQLGDLRDELADLAALRRQRE